MGLDNVQVKCLGNYGDRLVVGGNAGVDRFAPGSVGIVAWDGAAWSGFGAGVTGFPYAACQLGNDLFVGGYFDRAGDQPSFGIARWASPQPIGRDPEVPLGATLVRVWCGLATAERASIRYTVPHPGRVRLDVFDVTGSRIATLLDREVPAGASTLDWSPGSPAPFPRAGIYFLRLGFGARSASAKIVFAR